MENKKVLAAIALGWFLAGCAGQHNYEKGKYYGLEGGESALEMYGGPETIDECQAAKERAAKSDLGDLYFENLKSSVEENITISPQFRKGYKDGVLEALAERCKGVKE